MSNSTRCYERGGVAVGPLCYCYDGFFGSECQIELRTAIFIICGASISVFACVLQMVLRCRYPEALSVWPNFLSYCRSVCDVVFSLHLIALQIVLISPTTDVDETFSPYCQAFAVIFESSLMGSLAWCFISSLNLLRTVSDIFVHPRTHRWSYLVYVAIVVVVSSVCIVDLEIKEADIANFREEIQVCWTSRSSGVAWQRVLSTYMWFAIVFAFSVVVLLITYMKLRVGGIWVIVTNFPDGWNEDQCKTAFTNNCGVTASSVSVKKSETSTQQPCFVLEFNNIDSAKQALSHNFQIEFPGICVSSATGGGVSTLSARDTTIQANKKSVGIFAAYWLWVGLWVFVLYQHQLFGNDVGIWGYLLSIPLSLMGAVNVLVWMWSSWPVLMSAWSAPRRSMAGRIASKSDQDKTSAEEEEEPDISAALQREFLQYVSLGLKATLKETLKQEKLKPPLRTSQRLASMTKSSRRGVSSRHGFQQLAASDTEKPDAHFFYTHHDEKENPIQEGEEEEEEDKSNRGSFKQESKQSEHGGERKESASDISIGIGGSGGISSGGNSSGGKNSSSKASKSSQKAKEDQEKTLKEWTAGAKERLIVLDQRPALWYTRACWCLTTQRSVEFISIRENAFRYLRRCVYGCTEEEYQKSFLTGMEQSKLKGGRSGSLFFITDDQRFIVKSLDQGSFFQRAISKTSEKQVLEQLVDDYCKRMTPAMYHHEDAKIEDDFIGCESLLVKIYGMYGLHLYGQMVWFYVMEQLNYDPNNEKKLRNERGECTNPFTVSKAFDLKGSTASRYAKPGEKILKDTNFTGGVNVTRQHACEIFVHALGDVEFLQQHSLMDYSLLLLIHECKDARLPDEVHCTWTEDEEDTPLNLEGKEKTPSRPTSVHEGKEKTPLLLPSTSLEGKEKPILLPSTSLEGKDKPLPHEVSPEKEPRLRSSSKSFIFQIHQSAAVTVASDSSEARLEGGRRGYKAAFLEGDGAYFFGIIDLLQVYDLPKKCEHFFKRLTCRGDISAIEPMEYAVRFLLRVIREKFYVKLADLLRDDNVIKNKHLLFSVTESRVKQIKVLVEQNKEQGKDGTLEQGKEQKDGREPVKNREKKNVKEQVKQVREYLLEVTVKSSYPNPKFRAPSCADWVSEADLAASKEGQRLLDIFNDLSTIESTYPCCFWRRRRIVKGVRDKFPASLGDVLQDKVRIRANGLTFALSDSRTRERSQEHWLQVSMESSNLGPSCTQWVSEAELKGSKEGKRLLEAFHSPMESKIPEQKIPEQKIPEQKIPEQKIPEQKPRRETRDFSGLRQDFPANLADVLKHDAADNGSLKFVLIDSHINHSHEDNGNATTEYLLQVSRPSPRSLTRVPLCADWVDDEVLRAYDGGQLLRQFERNPPRRCRWLRCCWGRKRGEATRVRPDDDRHGRVVAEEDETKKLEP